MHSFTLVSNFGSRSRVYQTSHLIHSREPTSCSARKRSSLQGQSFLDLFVFADARDVLLLFDISLKEVPVGCTFKFVLRCASLCQFAINFVVSRCQVACLLDALEAWSATFNLSTWIEKCRLGFWLRQSLKSIKEESEYSI